MKRILTHAVTLLLIVFLLPVCSAEARSYDFKVLLVENCTHILTDGKYIYTEPPVRTYTMDMQPVEPPMAFEPADNAPRNHIEEYDWLDPKYNYASEASCGRIFVSEQPLPDKLSIYISPFDTDDAYAFRDSLYMDLTLMDLQGNVIMDGLQSDVFWEANEASKFMKSYTVEFRESHFTPTGIAYIRRDGKYGIIDRDGNLLFDFTLDMWEFCKGYLGDQGYVIAYMDGAHIIFDPYGGIYSDFRQVQQQYTDFNRVPPEYNTLIVRMNDKEGVIDAFGNFIVPIEYSWVDYVQKGFYGVTEYLDENKISYRTGLFNVETQTVDWWERSAPRAFITSEKNNIKSKSIDGSTQYYNEDFELVCEWNEPHLYDAQGNIIEGVSDYLNGVLINGINVYHIAHHGYYGTCGLIAINEIPEPQAADGSRYICMMLNNPLINLDGEVSTIVENNYFFTLPLENDRTLVPMRVIFEALGAQVAWDGDTQTVTATKGGKTMRLELDKNEMYLDDATVWLDTPPRLIEERTLVPLRAVSESFGADVLWDGDTQRITITWN